MSYQKSRNTFGIRKKHRFYLLYRNDVKMNFKIHGRFINLRSYLVHIFGPYRSILWHLKEAQEVDQLKLRKSYPTTHILYVTYTVYTVCNVHKLFQQRKKYHKVPNQELNHPKKPFQTMIKPYLVIILVEVAFQSSDLAVLSFLWSVASVISL